MSYSIKIGDYDGSITWNVMNMFIFAFCKRPWRPQIDAKARAQQREEIVEGRITRFKELDGCVAGEVLSFLEDSLEHMKDEEHREVYESMEPSNGWGTLKRTIEIFGEMIEACREHPLKTIGIY